MGHCDWLSYFIICRYEFITGWWWGGGGPREILCEDAPPNIQCLFYTIFIFVPLVNITPFTYLLNTSLVV